MPSLISRSLADTIPLVTLGSPPRLRALPMATTGSPTSRLALEPSMAGVRSVRSAWMRAMSSAVEAPTRVGLGRGAVVEADRDVAAGALDDVGVGEDRARRRR